MGDLVEKSFKEILESDRLSRMSYDSITPIVLGEGQGFGWFNLDETKKLKMIQQDCETLESVENYLKFSTDKR